MGVKGFVFSLDAMISLSIIILLIASLILLKYQTAIPERKYEQIGYVAADALNLLAELRVYEAKSETIKILIEEGVIKEEDLNRSVIDLIGSFWFSGNYSIAENISREMLGFFNSSCLRLEVENQTIYSSCDEMVGSVAISSMIESGYEVEKPVYGYVSRAWARKVRKNTTEIIPFLPEGSGWTANRLEVTKKFALPQDAIIYNATLWVSVHFGTSKTQAEFQNLFVNGVQKKNDIVWNYLEELYQGSEITTAAYGFVDVTKEIKPGNNTIYLAIGTPNYHSHLHPGMRLVVTYSLTQESREGERVFKKRYYFDDVSGYTGSWATASFFIPENAKNVSARLYLNLKEVEDTFDRYGRNSSDILIYINSKGAYFKDGFCSNDEECYPACKWKNFPYQYACTIKETKDVIIDLNITDEVKNGTNVVSVYVNCYGDRHWGDKESRIYSDPLNDPDNSSYVEVYYELDNPIYGYGEIDITKELIYGGNHSNPKEFNFTLNQSQARLVQTFTHVAQGFSCMINVSARNETCDWINVFSSPAVRAIPSSVFIEPKIFSPGKNYLKVLDFQPGGSLSVTNLILNYSSFEFTYLVKALVGYGKVFNSSDLAIEDAKNRLIEQIGAEGVSAEDIEIENKTVYGLRYPWGPALFKVLVWER